ncbi:MAG: hypothetical protein OER86_06375 [Phycisphaerae bacterium]|nr:hypothetical protein [Phycisphaerae bacterium]
MPTSTPAASVVMFLVASFLGALGSYLYKSGTDVADGTLLSLATHWRILAGIGCYTAVMVLFVAAFKIGGALTVLYPTYATTFIFGAIIGKLAYDVPIRPANVVGMGLLLVGMYLMGRQ